MGAQRQLLASLDPSYLDQLRVFRAIAKRRSELSRSGTTDARLERMLFTLEELDLSDTASLDYTSASTTSAQASTQGSSAFPSLTGKTSSSTLATSSSKSSEPSRKRCLPTKNCRISFGTEPEPTDPEERSLNLSSDDDENLCFKLIETLNKRVDKSRAKKAKRD